MKKFDFNTEKYLEELEQILNEICLHKSWNKNSLRRILSKYPKDGKGFFSKDQLLSGYKFLRKHGKIQASDIVLKRIQMKPVRTISGVAPITVLTKPFSCPGACVFCPSEENMPKSYLPDEPGAQRAMLNKFDPYLQIITRLQTLKKIGHSIEKIELIILGGTWSVYPLNYQRWFILRCFQALNDFSKFTFKELRNRCNLFENINDICWSKVEKVHKENECSYCRCVGLVIETRPDYINKKEILNLRKLGVTKVQIGIQTLNNRLLKINKRGHKVSDSKKAFALLRRSGFKIHAHWMVNLYGSDIESDLEDYKKLWKPDYRPDELKIYPTSIIKNTELYMLYKSGKYKPYSQDELTRLLQNLMKQTPRYCRITRVIRDISSDVIVAGNKATNLREVVEEELTKLGSPCKCIRCREIKNIEFDSQELQLKKIKYKTDVGTEYFLSYVINNEKIAGFLRLFLPAQQAFIDELYNNAIIREVHVYGQALGIGKSKSSAIQHTGLGVQLIDNAKQIAKDSGYKRLSVISAVGTRKYYRKLGFKRNKLYMEIGS